MDCWAPCWFCSALTGDTGRELLRYERPAVLHGEYWRLVTGHFVHGSAQHLLLNAVGLGLIAALFPRDYSLRGWLLILASSIATIDLGFVLLEPQLQWYVGLSGVLHGALAAGAIGWWRHESRPLALALTRRPGRQARLGAVARGAAAFRRHAGRCRCASIWCDRRRAGRRHVWLCHNAGRATSIAIIARPLARQATASNVVRVRLSRSGLAVRRHAGRARERRAARSGNLCRSVRSARLRPVEAVPGGPRGRARHDGAHAARDARRPAWRPGASGASTAAACRRRWPATVSASTPRWSAPVRSISGRPWHSCSFAARRCRQQCRQGRARWLRSSASTTPKSKLPVAKLRRAKSYRPRTSILPDRS